MALIEHQVMHRDIKPGNICVRLTRDPRKTSLILIDFGKAVIGVDRMGKLLSKMVARWYRAPELWAGKTRYDHGVDNWALACIMWEVFTGSEALFRDSQSNAGDALSIPEVIGFDVEEEGAEDPEIRKYYEKHQGAGTSLTTEILKGMCKVEWSEKDYKDFISMIKGFLKLYPKKRADWNQATELPFWDEPSEVKDS